MSENENDLPLEEFVKLPTTVDFQVINTRRFREYIKDKPYIRLGTQLENSAVVAYTNEKYIQRLLVDLGSDFFSFYPKIMSPLDIQSNEISGITQVLNQPFLDLSGNGVIIGIIDTGIDYTNKVFQFEDGSSKILSIWDQSIDGERSDNLYFGSTYSNEQINSALQSFSPLSQQEIQTVNISVLPPMQISLLSNSNGQGIIISTDICFPPTIPIYMNRPITF